MVDTDEVDNVIDVISDVGDGADRVSFSLFLTVHRSFVGARGQVMFRDVVGDVLSQDAALFTIVVAKKR